MESSKWVEWSPGKEREEERLSLNVWVDNAKKRVVLAEASSDFINVLFSFLTLPLGTIVKLLSKNSGLGSIDNLYDSIEKLEDQYWRTKACRNMLLSPRNVAEKYCEHLKLNVDGDNNPREFYYCKMEGCKSHSKYYFSSVRDTICHYCEEVMDEVELWKKVEIIENDEVFVKKNNVKYIITDDFHVKPYSMSYYYDMPKDFGVEDLYLMEVRTIEFGREELLNLLKKLLEGKEVLTKICFPDLCIRSTTPIYNDEMEIKIFERKDNAQFETSTLQITLFLNITNNNVVCAELEEELANQLFSFLTFPLGSVLGFIDYSNFLGCMPNLYNSIQELKINYFTSEEAKSMLISPQLPPFFGYNKQMLNIQEHPPYFVNRINICKKGLGKSYSSEIDPKLPMTDIDSNDGFVGIQSFVVTDDFHFTPMSSLSFTQIKEMLGLRVDHLEKREMSIGKAQVLNLLRAMLVSKTVLSDALFHCAKQAK
ncbi:hypothetical protein KFK09_029014 [Dendrobium nobile]|uniref:DUF674 family protein n=1 Tax=Dendrobium nobile TaxID=94219 RepID=A0A8T3A4T7_DENNO|nr:hypothetical protein KFK09_029014 [Dendrobium nobile]